MNVYSQCDFSYLKYELSKAFGNQTLSSKIQTKKSTFWDKMRRIDYKCDKLAETILGKDDPLIARGFGKQGS